MNRRGFIKGVALSAIAAPALLLVKGDAVAPRALVKSSVSTRSRTMFLVSGTYERAVAIHTAMAKPTNVVPIGIGTSVAGRQCDLMVMDDLPAFTPRGRDWWNQCMLTRMAPNALLAEYKQERVQSFDFGRLTGVSGSWTTAVKPRQYTATRLYKHIDTFSGEDSVRTAAVQILLFAKTQHGFMLEFAAQKVSPADTLRERYQNSPERIVV